MMKMIYVESFSFHIKEPVGSLKETEDVRKAEVEIYRRHGADERLAIIMSKNFHPIERRVALYLKDDAVCEAIYEALLSGDMKKAIECLDNPKERISKLERYYSGGGRFRMASEAQKCIIEETKFLRDNVSEMARIIKESADEMGGVTAEFIRKAMWSDKSNYDEPTPHANAVSPLTQVTHPDITVVSEKDLPDFAGREIHATESSCLPEKGASPLHFIVQDESITEVDLTTAEKWK